MSNNASQLNIVKELQLQFPSIKAKYIPAKTYFCEVEYKNVTYPPTVEINLENQDLGVDGFRSILTLCKQHEVSAQFFNGSRHYYKHVNLFISEGLI